MVIYSYTQISHTTVQTFFGDCGTTTEDKKQNNTKEINKRSKHKTITQGTTLIHIITNVYELNIATLGATIVYFPCSISKLDVNNNRSSHSFENKR